MTQTEMIDRKTRIVATFIIAICLGSSSLFGQWAIPPVLRAENTLDRLSTKDGLSQGDLLYGLPIPPGTIIGDTYLDKKWNRATILLYESDKVIEGYFVKYDIKGLSVELKAKNGIKLLDIRKVKSMIWLDSLSNLPQYFVNAKEYNEEGTPLTGLLEVVVDGQMPLFKKTYLWEKEPTYVVAFDVGSRDKKIYKKDSFYFGKGSDVTKITNKKNLIVAFGDMGPEMEGFIKTNKLDVSKATGVQKIFEYYNGKFERPNDPSRSSQESDNEFDF